MKLKKSIKKKSVILALLVSLNIGAVTTYAGVNAAEKGVAISSVKVNKSDIDDGIFKLNYNKNEVLAKYGNDVDSFVPKESSKKDGKFVVVERKKRNISSSPVDISIIDSITDRTYPGALQLANKNYVENKPDLLVLPRRPINISIDLPGLKSENTVKVKNPTYASVSSAVDNLVSNWNSKYGKTHTIPARTQYNESMVYSKSQIEAALNVNANFLEKNLGVDFNAISKGEKNVMIASYKQIFYTVSAEIPNKPSDLFKKNVTFSDLKKRGVSNDAPPVMVSNVAYGRTVYVKLETSSKSSDVKAAFSAAMKGADIKSNSKYENILKDSNFTAVVLGGDAATHNKVVSKNFDEIRNIIKENAQMSEKNPGYPISYTGSFLKDNSVAMVHNRSEYIETKSTEYNQGKINVKHNGGYVAQFDITWDEISYDKSGKEILTHREWSENWKDKTAPYSAVIPLPANAVNIKIHAREATGLAWDWWRDVVNESNIKNNSNINVYIGGTTLNPYGKIDR